GDQRVEGQEIECRGAIKEDERVISADWGEGFAELELSAFERDEFDSGADEVFAAGDELEVVDFGGEERFGDGCVAEKDVVDAETGFFAVPCAREAAAG